MKRFHIALSTSNIEESVEDYSKRMGAEPDVVVENQYALWRTETVNLSIRHDSSVADGQLRHLGWEEAGVASFTETVDVNRITWESFTAEQQADEINQFWPEAEYSVT